MLVDVRGVGMISDSESEDASSQESRTSAFFFFVALLLPLPFCSAGAVVALDDDDGVVVSSDRLPIAFEALDISGIMETGCDYTTVIYIYECVCACEGNAVRDRRFAEGLSMVGVDGRDGCAP